MVHTCVTPLPNHQDPLDTPHTLLHSACPDSPPPAPLAGVVTCYTSSFFTSILYCTCRCGTVKIMPPYKAPPALPKPSLRPDHLPAPTSSSTTASLLCGARYKLVGLKILSESPPRWGRTPPFHLQATQCWEITQNTNA